VYSGTAGKGATKPVAPFAFWLLLLAVTLAGSLNRPALAATCPADHASERAEVAYVYDGDTLKLKDGRRVRLIGINTPELGHKGQAIQPLAQAARTSLKDLLDSSNRKLLLQYGKQRHDRYGRALAHAFLDNGENIAAHLLSQGLATTFIVPPNSWGQHCYQKLEQVARAARLGLWALPAYQSHPARTLPLDTRGFRIINGRVRSIRRTRHTFWLDLEGPLTIQIPLKSLANFSSYAVDTLEGQNLEVRGWISANGDRLKVKVQHPAALVIITPPQKR
jgi:micrococcal nuclease